MKTAIADLPGKNQFSESEADENDIITTQTRPDRCYKNYTAR